MIISFGKYSGMDIKDVPRDYVEWLRDMRKKDLADYESELERRDMVEGASITMVERVVQEGYRALAKKMHPDTGGTDQEFKELKSAHEQLKMILREVQNVQSGTNSA